MQHTQSALAAKAIKNELKAIMPSLKLRTSSKNYSGGCSVRVSMIDEQPEVYNAVKKIADRYEYGSFDGMTDMYNYDNVDRSIPQAKYVFVENDCSDEMKQRIWDWMRNKYTGNYKGFPESYTEAARLRDENLHDEINQIVHRYFRGAYQYEEFWKEEPLTARAA